MEGGAEAELQARAALSRGAWGSKLTHRLIPSNSVRTFSNPSKFPLRVHSCLSEIQIAGNTQAGESHERAICFSKTHVMAFESGQDFPSCHWILLSCTQLLPYTTVPKHGCPYKTVPEHDSARTRLCPYMTVPLHDCAQT